MRASITARLASGVALEAHASGQIFARFGDGDSLNLGAFSPAAADRVQQLRSGLPLASLGAGRRKLDEELDLLVRRLAGHGLLTYGLGGPASGGDQVVIVPQVRDYWPETPQLADADILVLSRFAFMRRHDNVMVLESPRAGASFRIRDPTLTTAIAMLATPRQINAFRRQAGFPGIELLALLVDCRILCKLDSAGAADLRLAEGDGDLLLWDFHDLLFHTRSTEGRHVGPLGGQYPYAAVVPPLPAVRPSWPGRRIDLPIGVDAPGQAASPVARLLHERHSTRSFDDQHPITLVELSRFLASTARVSSQWSDGGNTADGHPPVDHSVRPYPSAGASYELELYLTVERCEGLARGFYHYDAGGHALVPVEAPTQELQALLVSAASAMDAPTAPQILITITARFARVSWKYSAIAYALILKDVGVLTQTFYLAATDLGLGGCAIGLTNINQFAKLTDIEFHVEGPVGQFALGRAAQSHLPGR